ncbi:MAG: alcohol dehydrogenase catalytic domain-containing protein [Candidatus Bathyarchaeia archaeon]
MKAVVIRRIAPMEESPLSYENLPAPEPKGKDILIRVHAWEYAGPVPIKFSQGDLVLVTAWIYSSCGVCRFCRRGLENLCENFMGTGCDVDGGYAEYIVANEDYASKIPAIFSDVEAAPLLCAGVIGYRALKLTGIEDGDVIGLYGFGSSAHIVFQLVRYLYPNSKIFVFTKRRGDPPS